MGPPGRQPDPPGCGLGFHFGCCTISLVGDGSTNGSPLRRGHGSTGDYATRIPERIPDRSSGPGHDSDDGVLVMIGRGVSAHQTSHQLICDVLRRVLRSAVESHRAEHSAIGSVPLRSVATLYLLLTSHSVDRRGRCRSCRYPGEVFGLRRRRCRVHRTAHFYLHHPDDAFLRSHLAREVGVAAPVVPFSARAPAVSPPPLFVRCAREFLSGGGICGAVGW